MLIVLIGKDEMHKLILPPVPSGSYTIDTKEQNDNKRLIEIESKDGKWQVSSDNNARVLNPKCIEITNGEIKIINSPEMFINKIILEEYGTCEIMIGDSETIYTLYCLPAYEHNWIHLDISNAKEITIGRDNKNSIIYKNKLVSDCHAKIFLNNGIWMIENYDEQSGIFLNDNLVYDKMKNLFNGDIIFIMGMKIIFMGDSIYISNPAKMVQYNKNKLLLYKEKVQKKKINQKEEDKYIELYSPKDYFYRSPRMSKIIKKEEIKLDLPPSKKTDDAMPMILTVGSTVSMGLMSVVTVISTLSGIIQGTASLGDSVISIIMAISMLLGMLLIPILTTKWEKKRDKEYEAKRQKVYKQYINSKREEIEKIKEQQRKILFENYATTEECTNIILNKSNRLWERITEDPDFLSINLGTGNRPLDINISYPTKEEFSMEAKDNLKEMLNDFTQEIEILKDAPVTVTLTKQKIMAYIDKDEDNINKFMQSMIIQLMAFQSYSDLKLVFLLNEDKKKKWEYVKRVPYVWNNEKDFRFFEDDTKNIDEISKYLEDEFDNRTNLEDRTEAKGSYKNCTPYYLIITDNYRKIENLKIITKILEEKENVGFSIFCIANDIEELPNECKTFISINGKEGRVFSNHISSKDEMTFIFDNVNTFFFDKIEKTISNIPIKQKLSEKNSLPNHYNFLEMYNVGLIEQLNILDRWNNNDSTLSLAAPIGIKGTGKLINLDIHEKFHGPHGLIAGSTGSGKSEFIITYILSLAINYHPDDVAFILIDYKGGGLAGAFKKQDIKLPHLVGTITNIDKEGLHRSLVSIQSEMKRRQVLFNEAREMTDGGTIDIYKYQKLYHTGVVQKPIPHLLIICDEFAELKQQQPDFMSELVSVSRIGRSLGVHLILATQKPSGVVDDEIRSNSKFAICLKVQDKSDSSDVIETPDAAYIKQAGRFYIKVGNNDYFDLGQSGWSGAPYYPQYTTKKQEDDSIKFISNTGTVIKEINDYTKKTVSSKGEQLTNIVKEMYNVAKQENIVAKQLWLDDIPETIYINQIKDKYKFKRKNNSVLLAVGEYDNPENQKQGIVDLDLTKNGNVIIYGNAESGKETLMSTMIYDLMTTYTTEEVWMYILDFGTEALKIFKEAPHVGEVILIRDGERLNRLFSRIKEIVNERKQILSEYNGDYNFYLKITGKKMPLITILLNGYDSFVENYDDMFDDLLLTLTREGAKTGVIFIMSTNTSGDLRYRMAQNFKQKIALTLNDSSDYNNIYDELKGKRPAHKFGRGLVNLGEEIYEFQTAKPCVPEEYNIFVKEAIERAKKENKMNAEKIPILPDVVKLEDLGIEINDLSKMLIGLKKKDIKPELYDFKNTLISIISSKNVEDAMQYATNIWQKTDSMQDIDTIILDPQRKVLSGKNELKDNYEKLIERSNKKSSKHNLCFIFGLERVVNYLEDILNQDDGNNDEDDEDEEDDDCTDGAEKLSSIIKKCEEKKNFSFIIIDVEDKIKEHNYDDWYKENVLESNIIWVGNGIEDQYLIDVNAPRKEINNNCGCSFGYINKKDRTTMIKLLEMKERRDDDE